MIYENNLQDNYKELDLFRKLPTKNEVVVDYIRDALNYITGFLNSFHSLFDIHHLY